MLVTAGPTREPIDPVRYITNRSSGKMGYASGGSAAAAQGAKVSPCQRSGRHLPEPAGIEMVHVTDSKRNVFGNSRAMLVMPISSSQLQPCRTIGRRMLRNAERSKKT